MVTEFFLLIILLAFLWFKTKKPQSMPPGSFGLPILGALPSADISLTDHFRQLQKKYGDIFTTKWGVNIMVVMTDFNLIKKAFQHPDLQGRPQFPSYLVLQQNKKLGIIFNDGQEWTELRRFVIHQLRDLGMGRNSLQSSVQDEAAFLVDYLEKNCAGKPSIMHLAINCAVVNVLWKMTSSTRYDIDDPDGTYYNEQATGLLDVMQTKMFLLDLFPVLHRTLPNFILNTFFECDKGYKHAAELHEMSKRVVQAHMQKLDPHNPRDLIDQFILHYGDSGAGYTLKDADVTNLISILVDLFQAGSETNATSIRWLILYMAVYPDIQTKVQKLIDEVVPSSRLPELDDRSRLPYLDALLLETMRLSSVVPTALMHLATADVPFEGYVIPKGTIIVGCAKICHENDSAWEKPLEFNPDRFLDENGELATRKDNFMPFSIGRRLCVGESLARMTLYLIGAAILQRFKIEPPEGVTLSLDSDPKQLIVSTPLPYKVVLKKRN